MTKQTIRSLTSKGWSQKKIAKTLGIRKMKVVSYQKTHKIGKRAVQPFWSDVKIIREMKGISHTKAIKEVKFSKKWFTKRQAKLTSAAKEKDRLFELWYRIKEGKVDISIFQEAEGKKYLEAVGYD